jgi:hypothetical protein
MRAALPKRDAAGRHDVKKDDAARDDSIFTPPLLLVSTWLVVGTGMEDILRSARLYNKPRRTCLGAK